MSDLKPAAVLFAIAKAASSNIPSTGPDTLYLLPFSSLISPLSILIFSDKLLKLEATCDAPPEALYSASFAPNFLSNSSSANVKSKPPFELAILFMPSKSKRVSASWFFMVFHIFFPSSSKPLKNLKLVMSAVCLPAPD